MQGAAAGTSPSTYAGDATAAEETAAAVRSAGGRALAVRGDVASEDDTAAVFDAAEAAFGIPAAVVANAGIVAPSASLADMDLARLRRVIDVNFLGALLTARETARRLSTGRGGPGGALVFVSSVASRIGAPGEYVDYAAAKGAVDTLTLGLAKELGPDGIRVNAVRPGVIATEIHERNGTPGRAERVGAGAPLGRLRHPEEIAEAILWLRHRRFRQLRLRSDPRHHRRPLIRSTAHAGTEPAGPSLPQRAISGEDPCEASSPPHSASPPSPPSRSRHRTPPPASATDGRRRRRRSAPPGSPRVRTGF